jgi:hypothetical protein
MRYDLQRASKNGVKFSAVREVEVKEIKLPRV